MGERGSEFADVVYNLLVIEKICSVEDAAAALGMSYAAFHARLINRTCFSADEIRALIRAVPDRRLVEYLLEGSRFVGASRVAAPDPGDDEQPPYGTQITLQRGATRVVIDVTGILEVIDGGLAGGGVDHRIVRLALVNVGISEHSLASLRLQLAAAL